MGLLYISEYARSGVALNGQALAAGEEPAVTTQKIGVGTTSLQSASFNAKTQFVRIHTDSICSVQFGTNPTATANDARLAANQTEYFSVLPGVKVAVITNT